MDGFDRAVKIPDDGYPNMGITEADSEKVIRGATYFIKNGDKLEGILCINHDTSELVDVMTKLISLENLWKLRQYFRYLMHALLKWKRLSIIK